MTVNRQQTKTNDGQSATNNQQRTINNNHQSTTATNNHQQINNDLETEKHQSTINKQ